MRAKGGALLTTLVLACGSEAPLRATADGGHDALAEAASLDGGACPASNDVFCNGFCQPESVNACGARCAVCPQPASSHGQSACADGTCQFHCDGGYASCGNQSCCGAQTTGDVLALAVGGDTTCGLTTAGAVSCWGDGAYGALANGSTGGRSLVPLPCAQLAFGVTAVALGGHHGCALRNTGEVLCWGDDEQGQLGDGLNIPTSTPHPPQGLVTTVAHVATGGSHTCVVTTGGAAYCWGDNTSGQLGSSSASSQSSAPVAVTGLASGVSAIAAGGAFTCALLGTGQLVCWGDGSRGQLGGSTSSNAPVAVPLPAPVKAIAAGANHACALAQSGSVLCWGADDKNQLGSSKASAHPAPLTVPGLAGITAIAAGGDETCAVNAVGAVSCWGQDPLGDVVPAPAGPGVVPSLAGGAASIGVTGGHACAVTVGGAPKCWGTNANGNLGDGTTTASWVPIDVTGI